MDMAGMLMKFVVRPIRIILAAASDLEITSYFFLINKGP
jgi:hypothetical protein